MSISVAENSININILPDELMIHVLKLLTLEDILICKCVCARWRKLSQDQTIWKEFDIVYSMLPRQSKFNEKNLNIIKAHSQNICCISLRYISDYSVLLSLLEKCENIISLEIVRCKLKNDFAERIKQWPRLQKINFSDSTLCSELPNQCDMLIDFKEFPKLTYLALEDFGMSTVNCNSLLHCEHLSHLLIDKIRNLALDDMKRIITATQDTLQTFHIYGDDAIDNSCLHLLSKCKLLKDLWIVRCDKLSDEGLVSLGNLKNLCDLNLWNNVLFSKKALLSIFRNPNLYNLKSLILTRVDCVSPEIVDFIAEHYKNLKFVALYECSGIEHYEHEMKSKFAKVDNVLSTNIFNNCYF